MIKKIINKFRTKKLDFIIIGAQKSGTTSLHHYLNKHPDIFMSNPLKEPRFFSPINKTKEYYSSLPKPIHIKSKKDLYQNYMLKGYKNEKLFGESSTDYTLSDRSKLYKIPKKIYKHNKNIKLIYIMREPFERTYSNYRHDKKMGRCEDLTFEAYLEKHKEGLIKTSLYYYQINQYLRIFPHKNILLLNFNELTKDTSNVLKKVFSFLGVNPNRYMYLDEYKTLNKGIEPDESDYKIHFQNNREILKMINDDQTLLNDLISSSMFEGS